MKKLDTGDLRRSYNTKKKKKKKKKGGKKKWGEGYLESLRKELKKRKRLDKVWVIIQNTIPKKVQTIKKER